MQEVKQRGATKIDYNVGIERKQLPIPQPRKKRYTRTILMAIALFTVGTILLVLGTQILYGGEHERGLYMVVLGSIMFIPGSYATTILYGAWKGWDGYHYDQIPSYDE